MKELLFEWSIFQGCTMYKINLLNIKIYNLHSWNIESKIFIKESYLWQILNAVAAAESVSDQTDDGGDDSPSQISSLVFLVRIVEVNPHTRLLSRLLLFYKYIWKLGKNIKWVFLKSIRSKKDTMIYDLEGTRKLIMGNIWNVFLNTFLL